VLCFAIVDFLLLPPARQNVVVAADRLGMDQDASRSCHCRMSVSGGIMDVLPIKAISRMLERNFRASGVGPRFRLLRPLLGGWSGFYTPMHDEHEWVPIRISCI
jgi:hypothetical protein